jgi:hypothetical protein
VAEFGTASTANPGFLPEVGHTIWARFQDLYRLGSTEPLASIFENLHGSLFARQHVGYENHTTLVAGNEYSAVGDLLNSHVKGLA